MMCDKLTEMKVCILGKSQVGKTRFSRALLSKKYLNKPTVDFHEEEVGNAVLIDTPQCSKHMLEKLVRTCKPDLALVIVDGSRMLSAADHEVIQETRKSGLRFEIVIAFGAQYYDQILAELPRNVSVHLVTNRRELKKFSVRDLDGQVFPLSISAVEKEQEEEFADEEEEGLVEPEFKHTNKLKWIVAGRENAGKSTLVNQLMGFDRVTVSSVPGTTQHSVELSAEYGGENFLIKDTAGVKRTNAKYISYLLEKKALVIFVLDGSKSVTHHDKRLLGEIVYSGLACVIALNKSDLPEFDDAVELGLKRLFKFIPTIRICALAGTGVPELVELAKQVESNATKRITTSKLNKWVEQNKQKFHGTKVKYACHVSTSPYEVAFFVSPMIESQTIVSHIRNMFQRDFGLAGVCVNALIKSARSSERAKRIPREIKERRAARAKGE